MTSTEAVYTGQVKWFNVKTGFGFITVVGKSDLVGKEIFVHYSSLRVVNSQYRYLMNGEYVEFRVTKPEGEKYEYHAVDVTGIFGGSLMCETRVQTRTPYEAKPRTRENHTGDVMDNEFHRPARRIQRRTV